MTGSSHRTVLITGCTTGGIGHALAKEFHKRGVKVFATTRNPTTMQDLVDDPDIEAFALDVCDEDSIQAAVLRVEKVTGGKLDILVNNAGGTEGPQEVIYPAVETDIEHAKAMYDLNFFSVIRMVKAFTPLLLNAGRTSPAHIFNIGSGAGEMPTPYVSAYGSAKAAVRAWGDTLRVELAPFNVTVTTVISGMTSNSKNVALTPLLLVPDSIYKPVETVFKETWPKLNASPMPSSVYAVTVVNEALKSNPRAWLYAGKMSTMIWAAKSFMPIGLGDYAVKKIWAFDKLREQWRASAS
ncbi:NAD(P)-binding protein [Peniophora sp. CONT]|nr:NAD(P)-binding protein [Peniophora sp. CONT]